MSRVRSARDMKDRAGAKALLVRLFLRLDCLETIFADGGYTDSLINWALSIFGWNMRVIKRRQRHVFEALPKRWIVERTSAWLSQPRRLSKAYKVTAFYSRSIREDCLHPAHGQALGMILETGS